MSVVNYLFKEYSQLLIEYTEGRLSATLLYIKLNELRQKANELEAQKNEVNENTSDGYHTFKELYDFRKAYNMALFNEWGRERHLNMNYPHDSNEAPYIPKYDVHKSWRHNDGELCFGGGWFIVVAVLPSGQISNHYKTEDWELFKIPVVDKAKYPFDGHTSQDVIDRLIKL